MNESNASRANDLVEQGIDQFILRRTIRIVDKSDSSGGGSGVTIAARGRYFVATAAHVVQRDHNYAILLRDSIPHLLQDFVAIHVSKKEDLALIELNRSDVAQFSNWHDFLDEDKLYLKKYPRKTLPLVIVGYPSFAIQQSPGIALNESESISFVNVETLSYDTEALVRAAWPKGRDFPTPAAKTLDIFCDYRPGEQTMFRRDMRMLDAPNVHKTMSSLPLNGMSGGGIWMPHQYTKPSGVVFSGAELVGIQFSYPLNGRGNWIRGVRSQAIVDILDVL